jgi:hypothetical protein
MDIAAVTAADIVAATVVDIAAATERQAPIVADLMPEAGSARLATIAVALATAEPVGIAAAARIAAVPRAATMAEAATVAAATMAEAATVAADSTAVEAAEASMAVAVVDTAAAADIANPWLSKARSSERAFFFCRKEWSACHSLFRREGISLPKRLRSCDLTEIGD